MKVYLIIAILVSALTATSQTTVNYEIRNPGKPTVKTSVEIQLLIKEDRIIEYSSNMNKQTEHIRVSACCQANNYVFNSKDRNLSFYNSNGRLVVNGTIEGRNYEREIATDGFKWYGNLELTLIQFVRQKLREMTFVLADPLNPDNSSILQFVEEDLPFELPVELKHVPGVRYIKMTPTGWLSSFWQADILIDEHGYLLYYKANNGPGTPTIEKIATSISIKAE